MKSLSVINSKIRTAYFIVLVSLAVSLLPVTTAQASSSDLNVVGGKEIEANAYPWTVALIENGTEDVFWAQYCGGTLVHPQWVLTAAHCTYISGKAIVAGDIDILVGQDELRATNGERISVEQIIRHPSYDKGTGDADLALIKLATPSTQPVVQIAGISMAEVDDSAAVGTVIGWGRTESQIRVNHLKQVNVPLVTNETCASAYSKLGYTLTGNMLCAGYAAGGMDACSGDSGGPLVIKDGEKWVQVGVVSWGKGCAQAGAYGVYTHVALFAGWIDTQISLAGVTGSADTVETTRLNGQSSGLMQVFLPMVTR